MDAEQLLRSAGYCLKICAWAREDVPAQKALFHGSYMRATTSNIPKELQKPLGQCPCPSALNPLDSSSLTPYFLEAGLQAGWQPYKQVAIYIWRRRGKLSGIPGCDDDGTEAHSRSRKNRGLNRPSLSFMVAATVAFTAWLSTRPTSHMAAGCCCRQFSACISSSKMAAACSAATAVGMLSVAVCSIVSRATAESSPSCPTNTAVSNAQ